MVANNAIPILLLESNEVDQAHTQAMLRDAPASLFHFRLETAGNFEEGLRRLRESPVEVVLLNPSLCPAPFATAVQQLHAVAPQLAIIALGDVEDEALALGIIHQGAQDYLVKSQLTAQLLNHAIHYAMERQKTEVALFEAEEKYRSIFEHSVEGIFQTTPEGRYLSANQALARIYGYDSPDELMASLTDIGKMLYVRPQRREEFTRLLQEKDVVTDFESQVYRKDGRVIWISENARAHRDAQGKLLFYEGAIVDITERKRAEENLRNSEALYHSLVENLPQNILRKDLEGRFTFANQRFCETLGYPLQDIIGKTDFDFFPKKLAEKYQRDDRRVLETGRPFEAVEENRPPGGQKYYVQVVKTPLHDARGKIIGIQGIFWDITERKLAEQRVRRANLELARSREELRAKNQQMEEDLRMAREIQMTILPQLYPVFPPGISPEQSAIRFSHFYLPTMSVGGDFFNVLPLSDSQAGVFICDVMGHGVRSALVTAMVRALVEELKPMAADPGGLLTQLNRDLCSILKNTGSPLITTAFYLIIDLARGRLRFSNAGHPQPLLLHRSQSMVEPLKASVQKPRPALGIFEESTYSTTEVRVSAGDMVMLYTDGLYEAEDAHHHLYSFDQLLHAVEQRLTLPTPTLFEELLKEVEDFANQPQFVDDVCLVGADILRLLK